MKVYYSLGATISLGEKTYQFIRPEIGVEVEAETFEEGCKIASDFVYNKLQEHVNNINAHYGTFFELPPKVG